MLFDFFGLAPTTHHSPRLDALSALLPDYAKRLRKRGVTRKTLYSEYIKCYPQEYSYCSFNRFLHAYMASHNSLFKGFDACGPPANHFLKGLAFPRLAKVISRMVWHFRARRKSFPERFGIYFSTVIDDYSRYIIHWELCSSMTSDNVSRTIDKAIEKAGVTFQNPPCLLSDNGPCYIASSLK